MTRSMIQTTRSILRPSILAMLVGAVVLARPAAAQVTDADLVRENERLTAEVRDLEAALAAALARIESLEKELAAVRAGGPSPATPSSPTTAAAPPQASVEGVIREIKAAFAKAVEDGEIESIGSSRDEAARVRRLRDLRKWTSAANRAFKTPIEWPVLVLDSAVVNPSDGRLQVQVWNPETAATVGEAFVVAVPRRVVDRVNRPRPTEDDGPAVFLLDGVFIPDIRVMESRLEAGPFDNPPFIGPMVEMDWRVETKGIGPWTPPEATAVADEGDG